MCVCVCALDSNIVASEFELQSWYYIVFGKDMNPLISKLWVKYYHIYSSTRTGSVLNNQRKWICY